MADEQGKSPEPDRHEAEPDQFPREYVEQLRAENKKYRTSLRDALEKQEAEARKLQEANAAALAEQGKYKELYEKLKAEYDPMLPELNRFREADKQRRASLLEKLPEDKRELYAGVDTNVLADVVDTLTKDKQLPMKGVKPGGSATGKKWSDMSEEERQELRAANKELALKLYNEDYKARNGVLPPFRPF